MNKVLFILKSFWACPFVPQGRAVRYKSPDALILMHMPSGDFSLPSLTQVLTIISVLSITIGCSKKADDKKVSPSKVENPVKESELTTVKLTEQAVERLGIKTAEVVQKKVSVT